MDKNAIKKYAVWARRELIERVSQRALIYGITAKDAGDPNAESVNGHLLSQAEKRQRQALIRHITEKGYEQVMEEVAYTWFNRFAALRFMEVNGYLPSHIRVFTNDAGEFKPQILAEAIHLELDGLDMNKVYELESANKSEELFKYLLIVQCNALNSILPGMFQRIEDYTELLLPDYLLREGSVIEQMVTTIPEEDWTDQVQIIGWLYQYYISSKHDEVVDVRKKTAITKENLPAATQIFTTDWVVKYMVDNSLGKYWVNKQVKSNLRSSMDFYIESDEDIPAEAVSPESITFLDTCMGSGHILLYAFDMFLEIYRESGFSDREAVERILSNNLYGIDIDERAFQLTSFSLAMKARSVDRRFFSKSIGMHLTHVPESNSLDIGLCKKFIPYEYQKIVEYIYFTFFDAKEYGALISPKENLYDELSLYLNGIKLSKEPTFDEIEFIEYALPLLKSLVEAAIILSKDYKVVCTNPPYHNKYDKKLEKYILDNYPEGKADLYSVFLLRNLQFCCDDGLSGMMTPHGWMFTKSYEAVRNKVLRTKSISTLVHMSKGAFYSEAAVDICSFVLRNHTSDKRGIYFRLEKFKGDMDMQREKVLEAINTEKCEFVYKSDPANFFRIDGNPISYWASEALYQAFENGIPMKKISPPRQGMATTNNDRFLRMWFEIPFYKIGFGMKNEDDSAKSGKKFFPYNKGGEFRRWYGNNYYVVNFENHGKELCDYIDVTAAPKFNHKNRVINREYYFRECITWSDISAEFSGRYCPSGFIFDIKGSSGFPPKDKLFYILGLLNSRLTQAFIDVLNPTITTQVGDISRIPILYGDEEHIETIVESCVEIGKTLWNSQEISWEFRGSPLIYNGQTSLEDACERLNNDYLESLTKLRRLEEQLNASVFAVYNLENLISEYPLGEFVTERIEDQKCVKDFISYSVGCLFGRYSLDVSGLIYAGGEWNDSQYITYQPDKDAIIPICDDEYFDDDIVARFVSFIETVYGKQTLEENLRFIADALGGKGSAREVIRNYFLNGFFADHCKIYQKRPIYWLFDSGKKNGFKCLIYMHRYQPDTIARIRTDYVHEQQSRFRTAIADLEQRINGASTSDRVKLSKQLATLQAQSEEIRVYEEKIHHLADQMIAIDLDDGVKVNYAKFQDVLAKIK